MRDGDQTLSFLTYHPQVIPGGWVELPFLLHHSPLPAIHMCRSNSDTCRESPSSSPCAHQHTLLHLCVCRRDVSCLIRHSRPEGARRVVGKLFLAFDVERFLWCLMCTTTGEVLGGVQNQSRVSFVYFPVTPVVKCSHVAKLSHVALPTGVDRYSPTYVV